MNFNKTVELDPDTFIDNHFELFIKKAREVGFNADQLALLENGEVLELSEEVLDSLGNVEVEFSYEAGEIVSGFGDVIDGGEPATIEIESVSMFLGEKEIDMTEMDIFNEVESELFEGSL